MPDFLGVEYMVEDELKRRFGIFPPGLVGAGDSWVREYAVHEPVPTDLVEKFRLLHIGPQRTLADGSVSRPEEPHEEHERELCGLRGCDAAHRSSRSSLPVLRRQATWSSGVAAAGMLLPCWPNLKRRKQALQTPLSLSTWASRSRS